MATLLLQYPHSTPHVDGRITSVRDALLNWLNVINRQDAMKQGCYIAEPSLSLEN